MRALVDTDVLLDVALKREPFFAEARELIRWAQDEPGQVGVAWHSLSNLAYLVRPDARSFISHLLQFIEVASTGSREAKQAMGFPMADLEDALQSAAALAAAHGRGELERGVEEINSTLIPERTSGFPDNLQILHAA